jgi:hypothetical protein
MSVLSSSYNDSLDIDCFQSRRPSKTAFSDKKTPRSSVAEVWRKNLFGLITLAGQISAVQDVKKVFFETFMALMVHSAMFSSGGDLEV